MIAIDTSSLIAFLEGAEGADVEAVDTALELYQAALPPVVLSELLSNPKLDPRVGRWIGELPLLEVHPGYWQRAARTRATLLSHKLKARLADTLIAQSCIDHRTPLITRDTDFRHFAAHAKLRLI